MSAVQVYEVSESLWEWLFLEMDMHNECVTVREGYKDELRIQLEKALKQFDGHNVEVRWRR